jgi:hypothetical protein
MASTQPTDPTDYNQEFQKLLNNGSASVPTTDTELFNDMVFLDNELFKMVNHNLVFRQDDIPVKNNYCGRLEKTSDDCKKIYYIYYNLENNYKLDTSNYNYNLGNDVDEIYRNYVQKLHPDIVLKILNKLDFKQRTTFEGFKKLETVDEHIKRKRNTNLKFEDNDKTKNFIKALVQYMDRNSFILNSKLTPVKHDYHFKSNYGLPRPSPRRSDYAISALRNRISDYNRSLRIEYVYPMMMVFRGGSLSQFGGSQLGGDVSRPALNKEYQQKYAVSKVFREIYNLNLQRLKEHNKDLSQNTKNSIEEQFKKLQEHEEKVVYAINILEKYSQITAKNKDFSNENVSSDKMKETVQKYNHLLDRKERRELSILSILEAIVKAIETEGTSNDTQFEDLPTSVNV